MRKFRVPEIALGFALGVVASLFVAGIGSYQTERCKLQQASERQQPPADNQIKSPAGHESDQGNKKIGEDTERPEPFSCGTIGFIPAMVSYMDHHEGFFVGGFTFVLAIATILLWRSTNSLWEAGERQLTLIESNAAEQAINMKASIAAAKDTADAAKKSADAFMGVEVAQLLCTNLAEKQAAAETPVKPLNTRLKKCSFVATLTNLGRTTAVVTHQSIAYAICDRLPGTPEYEGASIKRLPHPIDMTRDKPLPVKVTIKLTDEQISIFEAEGKTKIWIYGLVRFQDFMGITHEQRFCGSTRFVQSKTNKKGITTPARLRFAVGGPPEYTKGT